MITLSVGLLLGAVTANGNQPQAVVEDNFEAQCQSAEDYGWPRFHSVDELKASPWATYFMHHYGDLPSKYPVCIYDFWAIDATAYKEANITGHKIVPASEVKEGDLFEGGLTGLQIYHGKWEPLPDNTWVEVLHTVFPTELQGMWVWRQRGSGIWYNTGKTKVFPTPADPSKIHQEAIQFLTANCSKKPSANWPQLESDIFGFCAREKGYNSIQFQPAEGQKPLGSFGITGVTEMVLVSIDGTYACGVPDKSKTPLRAGWMASRQCDCENHEIPDSCGLMPKPPFPYSVIGTSPPLCKLRAGHFWNRWKSCDPSTCIPSSCKASSNHATGKYVSGNQEPVDTKAVVV